MYKVVVFNVLKKSLSLELIYLRDLNLFRND